MLGVGSHRAGRGSDGLWMCVAPERPGGEWWRGSDSAFPSFELKFSVTLTSQRAKSDLLRQYPNVSPLRGRNQVAHDPHREIDSWCDDEFVITERADGTTRP